VEEEEEEMGLEKDMEDNVTIVTDLVILRMIVEIKCMIWKIKAPIRLLKKPEMRSYLYQV